MHVWYIKLGCEGAWHHSLKQAVSQHTALPHACPLHGWHAPAEAART